MASVVKNPKKFSKNKRTFLLIVISFFVFALIFGIKSAYAYYNDSSSLSILANLIGDFENGNADSNMVFYKQNAQGLYVRTYAIPPYGYSFNEEATSCSIPCSNNESSDCYYEYDETNKVMSMTSLQKVTCKFYFDLETESDITVYILKEDESGAYEYNSKLYSLVEAVPAYGYKYIHSYCENGSAITYNASKNNFSVSTSQKEVCYGYFDSIGNSELNVNVFIQYAPDSTSYKQVDTIPANAEYVLSERRSSYCYNDIGATNAFISYEDGYINIDNALSKQSCNVYLDYKDVE